MLTKIKNGTSSDYDTQREKNNTDSLNVPKGHQLFQKLCFKMVAWSTCL